MPTYEQKPVQHLTKHSLDRMAERGVTSHDLAEAAADAYIVRQAGGRREVRGRNNLTFITDATGEVLITVLPPGARPAPEARRHSGISRHRPNRLGPKGRDDRRRPRR